MTILAHNAAVLEVPFDSALLFGGDDLYALWLEQLVDRVGQTHDAEARRFRSQQRYEDEE